MHVRMRFLQPLFAFLDRPPELTILIQTFVSVCMADSISLALELTVKCGQKYLWGQRADYIPQLSALVNRQRTCERFRGSERFRTSAIDNVASLRFRRCCRSFYFF